MPKLWGARPSRPGKPEVVNRPHRDSMNYILGERLEGRQCPHIRREEGTSESTSRGENREG